MNRLLSLAMTTALLVPLMGQGGSAPKKSSDPELERALRQAMATNPELLLARAKLQEAKAALLMARVKVAQDVVTFVHERRLVRSKMATAIQAAERARSLHEAGSVNVTEVFKAEEALIETKARMERLDARARFTRDPEGFFPKAELPLANSTGSFLLPPATLSEASIPKALRTALNGKVDTTLKGPLESVVTQIFESRIKVVYDRNLDPRYVKNPPSLGSLEFSGTCEDALTAVADLLEIAFIVRPYGLFATTLERAKNYRAITIPTGLGR